MKLYGSNARVSRTQMRAARLNRPIEGFKLGPPRVVAGRRERSSWIGAIGAWLRTTLPAHRPSLPERKTERPAT